MAGKITGFDQRPVQVANRGATERTAGKSSAAPGAATSDAAHVKLTGSAMQLAALEKALAQVPEIDLERVQQLRSEIESGTYQVDSQRVASKLMQLERALAATAVPVAEQAPVDVPGQQV